MLFYFLFVRSGDPDIIYSALTEAGLLTKRLCTAFCDWLTDFWRSWRRVSDVWT
jgi:hypothetical protein